MSLPRLQLFELEDLPWFPPTIRDLATDYLHFIETRFRLHECVIPILRKALERSNTSTSQPILRRTSAAVSPPIEPPITMTRRLFLGINKSPGMLECSSLEVQRCIFALNELHRYEDQIGITDIFEVVGHPLTFPKC